MSPTDDHQASDDGKPSDDHQASDDGKPSDDHQEFHDGKPSHDRKPPDHTLSIISTATALVALLVSALSAVAAFWSADEASKANTSAAQANRLAEDANGAAEDANLLAQDARRDAVDLQWLERISQAIADCRSTNGELNEGAISRLRDQAFDEISTGTFNRESYQVEVATALPNSCRQRVSGLVPPEVDDVEDVDAAASNSSSDNSTGGSSDDSAQPAESEWALQVSADASLDDARFEVARAEGSIAFADRVAIFHRPGSSNPWRTIVTGYATEQAAASQVDAAEEIWPGGGLSIVLPLTQWCPDVTVHEGYVECISS